MSEYDLHFVNLNQYQIVTKRLDLMPKKKKKKHKKLLNFTKYVPFYRKSVSIRIPKKSNTKSNRFSEMLTFEKNSKCRWYLYQSK